MRICHITEYCHAGSVGGTERYVLDLIRGLTGAGIENSIAWLNPGISARTFESDGVRIGTLPSPLMRVDAPLPQFAAAAAKLLDREKPDCLHFHTFGLTEAAMAALAKRRGIPSVFTYHSPAWTCRRGTGLLYGKETCDGEVRAWRCSTCQSEQRLGMGILAGHVATAASLGLGWAGLPLGQTSFRRRTAFYYDTARFRRAIRSFLTNCDLVVSCCDWSGPVLQRNGARAERIVHCPQGVPYDVSNALDTKLTSVRNAAGADFVVGYLGRVTEAKGVHILAEGFSRLTEEAARLRIVGWEPDRANDPFAQHLRRLADADRRIELVPQKPLNETVAEYQRMSVLAIPSTWMETGPLTLLEGLALGVPVFGSNRVGQLNLLREHGRVVEPNTPAGWEDALSKAFSQWKQGAWSKERPALHLRTMADVAEETMGYYRKLTEPRPAARSLLPTVP